QLNLGKKRDGEQRNLPGTRNVLSRYAGGGRGPWPSPRCRRDYGVAAGISLQPASPHSPGVIARKLLLSGTAVAIALVLAAAVWAQTGSPMMRSSPYTAPAASAPMKPNTSGAESLAATREKTVSCRPGR